MKKSQSVKVVRVTLERHIPLTEKTCVQCGGAFVGQKNKQYCSRACVQKAAYWRNPDAYRQSRLRSYRRQKEKPTKE
jgi:hypothetical protein